MSAAGSSLYEILTLESNDKSKTVDLRLGAVSIDYYEDIFSPTITAKVRVINTGDSITNDKSDKLESIYNGLPLRGGERLRMKISDEGKTYDGKEKPGLDFATTLEKYLYVSSITDVISQSQKESFLLNLVSREAITNETARVFKKYQGTIDQSVTAILKNVLKTTRFDKENGIDKAQNKYSFIGNSKKPFTTLVWLASKAVPVSSGDVTAGFVFYQTKDGFKFKSIDGLIGQEPKATYYYSEVNESGVELNNDFKILNYSTNKNQNLIEKLRLGAYSSERFFFDPLTGKLTPPEKRKFQLKKYKDGLKNLGTEGKISLPKLSENSTESLGDAPTRILVDILSIGTLNNGVSTQKNADPSEYAAQSIMRYNLLLTQSISMMVPCNTDLNAGDVINCAFPKVSSSDTDEFDPEVSGPYIIKELCHHFEPNNSYTSLKLVRDNFGPYNGERNTAKKK
jgi:hypothetical protein